MGGGQGLSGVGKEDKVWVLSVVWKQGVERVRVGRKGVVCECG